MLLVQVTGSVKIGEIVRYTVTYTPSLESSLPTSEYLHLRIKNTASLALRAAYLHGPYSAYVSVRRQEFHPYNPWDSKIEGDDLEVPQYEPNLKAGASFYTLLRVPEKLREHALGSFTTEGTAQEKQNSTSLGVGSKEENGPHTTPNSTTNGKARAEHVKSVTWIVEIISQTIFSTRATVGFEVLIGTDEKSVGYGLGFGPTSFPSLKSPLLDPSDTKGKDNDTGTGGSGGETKTAGVLSPSIKLKVQDTADLWNLPPFPSWSEEKSESSFPGTVEGTNGNEPPDPDELDEREQKRKKDEDTRRKKRITKKVHLVIITHGLHSNTGADMLFMKEAIDEEARRAEEIYQEKRRMAMKQDDGAWFDGCSASKEADDDGDDDREMTIVRGFHENVCRTERGIKYLGKRLAKYILTLANPEKPNPHPLQNTQQQPRTPNKLRKQNYHPHLTPAARASSIPTKKPPEQPRPQTPPQPPYKVTSISFIGHSLGGLVQTYAIAYIHAHHPNFFEEAKPINFVALASPFLGLSNENPVYIKFALDFGLVGRTGQDLGLTWRAPNMAASALNALANHAPFANSRDTSAGNGDKADITKPLLRILPTGPAHDVFKMFRNRTVYANVVNDGIVPLRTSCLLYLDWKGLGKVEKARRENQVVGLVGWGWQQLTTGNSGSTPRLHQTTTVNTKEDSVSATSTITSTSRTDDGVDKAQLAATQEDRKYTSADHTTTREKNNSVVSEVPTSAMVMPNSVAPNPIMPPSMAESTTNPFSSLMTLFRPQAGKRPSQDRIPKIYHRSQITPSGTPIVSSPESPSSPIEMSRATSPTNLQEVPSIHQTAFSNRPSLITSYDDFDDPITAPPRTSILEAAGDVLNPPLPTVEFIINPAARPKTIWHDRIYHSEDIPPPPVKERPKSILGLKLGNGESNGGSPISSSDNPSRQQTFSSDTSNGSASTSASSKQQAQLKVEEKIARAYHKDLSWRKVLVRLEPDAHNNIVVRRMFANAYGWPVVRHVVDTHFGDTLEARTADVDEGRVARPIVGTDQEASKAVNSKSPDIKIVTQTITSVTHRHTTESPGVRNRQKRSQTNSTEDSGQWSDTAFKSSDDENSGEGGSAEAKGDSTSSGGSQSKNTWSTGLGIKWRLGNSNSGGGEENVAGNAAEELNEFFKAEEPNTHTTAPIAAVSKIDAWAHGNTSGEVTPTPSTEAVRRPHTECRGSYLLDDATKVGLGTGCSHAMRELEKFNRTSMEGEMREGSSTITSTVRVHEDGTDEGVAERVARLGFRK